MIIELLCLGADPDGVVLRSGEHSHPLKLACQIVNRRIVEDLLKARADPWIGARTKVDAMRSAKSIQKTKIRHMMKKQILKKENELWLPLMHGRDLPPRS